MADPFLLNQALAAQGSAFRLPLAGAQAQPLTPDEASFMQQAALGQDVRNAQMDSAAAANPEAYAAQTPQSITGGTPGLGWQPPTAPASPAPARMPQPTPVQQVAPPPAPSAGGAPRARAGGGGGGSVLDRQAEDATTRRLAAEQDLTRSELAGEDAQQALERTTREQGANQASTYANIAKIQQQQADGEQRYMSELEQNQQAYRAASDKTEARARDMADFIGNYQPRDRRSTGQRVMGALASILAAAGDQANLAAGLNMGVAVQTNNADRVAALIQRGIDRDLEQQQAMLDNKRTQLAATHTELGQIRQRYGDSVDALRMGQIMKLDQSAAAMEAEKTRGMSKEAAALADETIAKLQMRSAELKQAQAHQDFATNYQNEQQLARAQEQRRIAAAGAPLRTAKQLLELQAKGADIAKTNAETAKLQSEAANGKPLTAEQQAKASFLKGYETSTQTLARAIASGSGAPGALEKHLPDMMRSTNALAEQAAENAMLEANLRIESGASISEGDVLAKRKSTGLDSSDPAIRLAARRLLLEQTNAKREGLGLEPINPIVRRGAAR